MKNILSIFLLLTITSNLLCQDFSVIVKKPFNAALFDITQDYDRTITAVGFSKDFQKNSNNHRTFSDPFEYLQSINSAHGSQMHLIKVDDKENILLSKIYHLARFNEAKAVVKTPQDGYFVGGYTLDGSLIVLKLDADANIQFTKIFGTKNYDRMSNLILLSDGGVLAVGSSTTSRSTQDDMFNTGLGNTDIFLTRFSKDGAIVWSKKYGTSHDDVGIDATEAADGSIVVISATS